MSQVDIAPYYLFVLGKTDRRVSSQTVRMRAKARNGKKEAWQEIPTNARGSEIVQRDSKPHRMRDGIGSLEVVLRLEIENKITNFSK